MASLFSQSSQAHPDARTPGRARPRSVGKRGAFRLVWGAGGTSSNSDFAKDRGLLKGGNELPYCCVTPRGACHYPSTPSASHTSRRCHTAHCAATVHATHSPHPHPRTHPTTPRCRTCCRTQPYGIASQGVRRHIHLDTLSRSSTWTPSTPGNAPYPAQSTHCTQQVVSTRNSLHVVDGLYAPVNCPMPSADGPLCESGSPWCQLSSPRVPPRSHRRQPAPSPQIPRQPRGPVLQCAERVEATPTKAALHRMASRAELGTLGATGKAGTGLVCHCWQQPHARPRGGPPNAVWVSQDAGAG